MVFRIALACVAVLILGNVAILAASAVARETTGATKVHGVPGIHNLEAVDGKLWRGAAPTDEGYAALAAAGTTTIVDLRAEDGLERDAGTVARHGMVMVRLPIRDGQTPSGAQVDEFLAVMENAPGRVFVHCGAGVGRTGTMVGAYLVTTGDLNGRGALRRNLAVGPPSLEQIAFVAGMERGDLDRPGVLLRAASRVLDAPRRLWVRLGM